MTTDVLRRRRRFVISTLVVGACVGAAFLGIGLSHDSQSEFRLNDGRMDLGFAIKVFVVWFVIGALAWASMLAIGAVLKRRLGARRRGPKHRR